MTRIKLTILLLCMTIGTQAQDNLFVLGGELSNSAATCVADIDEVMPLMQKIGLNTVLVPAYWEFLEPEEGHFDFTLIDRTIQKARENELKIVFLWFGAWKNSMSCYAPLWFKENTKRFPRARSAEGKPLEIASCFSEEVFNADNKAFESLVRHIASTGSDVVTMIQVENEIGMLEDARDHSRLANDTYKKGVPDELKSFLKKQKLHPWLAKRFDSKGKTWTEVFGDDIYTDEIFMAYYYAKYVGRLCNTARQHSSIPLYVNAAMNSRGRQPGQYPSAGPLAHLIDIWHAGAPQLLCLAPDIYDTGFKGWADQYALWNNKLFIPESRCCENSGARAMYAFGEHKALGFSPFAIDQSSEKDTRSVTKAYELLKQLERGELLNSKPSWGLLFDQTDKERVINDERMAITCRHYYTLPWDPRATDGSIWPEGGAILMKIDKNEYILAGTGVVVTFASEYEKKREQQKILGEDGFVMNNQGNQTTNSRQVSPFKGQRIGIGFVDEITINETGQFMFQRRLNGDQDHQGRHVRIACGDWKILHICLYKYE